MLIESIENKKIKSLKKLHLKKYREQEEMFLVEGIHLVSEAYKTGNLLEVLLLEGSEINLDVNKIYSTFFSALNFG